MFPFIWCGPTFYFVVLLSNVDGKDTKNSSEKIFAGVIQNITRVNKVLEELIQNYENLQKIYDSQEVFLNTEHLSQNESKTLLTKSINTRTDNYPATEMIWSDQKELETEETSERETTTTDKVLKTSDTQTNPDNRKSPENVLKLILLTSDEDVEKRTPKELSKTEILFIDPHKKLIDETEKVRNSTNKKTRFSIQPSKAQENMKVDDKNKKSHRFVNGTSPKTKDQSKDKHITTTSTARSVIIFRGTTVATLSPGKNRSGIRTHDIGMINKIKSRNKSNGKKVQVGLVKLKQETTDRGQNNKILVEENNVDDSIFFSDDDETLTNDEFKTSILRKAYGDACLKLVIRKCYKACKTVLVTVGRTQKNKEVFKESYDRFSRTGCIKAFTPAQVDDKEKQQTKKSSEKKSSEMKSSEKKPSEESQYDENRENRTKIVNTEIVTDCSSESCVSDTEVTKKSILKSMKPPIAKTTKVLIQPVTGPSESFASDKTKLRRYQISITDANNRDTGYLATYCQLHNRTESAIVTPDNNNLNDLNILRSKYEKACIKTSREKCNDACTFSYTKACEENGCKEKKKKLFGKTCKRQCAVSFKGTFEKNKKKSSSSSSETESSSSDESSE